MFFCHLHCRAVQRDKSQTHYSLYIYFFSCRPYFKQAISCSYNLALVRNICKPARSLKMLIRMLMLMESHPRLKVSKEVSRQGFKPGEGGSKGICLPQDPLFFRFYFASETYHFKPFSSSRHPTFNFEKDFAFSSPIFSKFQLLRHKL